MSFIDDTCDFCGSRFDPMGDPWLLNTDKGVWDGCQQGREILFKDISTEKLQRKLQSRLQNDPNPLIRSIIQELDARNAGK